MKRTDFAYELPEERIAQEPRERGRSRMMVVTPPDSVEDDSFANFPSRLQRGDVLVINDTRVIPARLYARPKGQMTNPIEFLLTRERDPATWETWCRPAKRVKPGDVVTFSDTLSATVVEKEEGTVVIRFLGDVREIERLGIPPLPPYIQRPEPRESDREAYQTVYAAARGAVAAPTAGLHFTPELLGEMERRGIERAAVTLHVGYGTFKPVRVTQVEEHQVDPEPYEIGEAAADAIARARAARRRIIAVGTTTTRALEDAVRRGDDAVRPGRADAALFIHPGVAFEVVDGLMTNFHLPQSSLLMLVCAFAGREHVLAAYAAAVRERYRFYSYGDAMLIT